MLYDEGYLEIMSPSYEHENVKGLIGRLVEAYTEDLNIDVATAGSTTLGREDLLKGVESDESYYIEHAARIRGQAEVTLPDDPPPDLVIEVDVPRSSSRKMGVFAALGVAEVWRFAGQEVAIFVLDGHGEYQRSDVSRVLPGFPLDEMNRLLLLRSEQSETEIVRTFRRLIRHE